MRIVGVVFLSLVATAACGQKGDKAKQESSDAIDDAAVQKPYEYPIALPGFYQLPTSTVPDKLLATPRAARLITITGDKLYGWRSVVDKPPLPGAVVKEGDVQGWLARVTAQEELERPRRGPSALGVIIKDEPQPLKSDEELILRLPRRSLLLDDHHFSQYVYRVSGWAGTDQSPVLFADKALHAARVVQVVSQLCRRGAYLAVARNSSRVAASWVTLGTFDVDRCDTSRKTVYALATPIAGGIAIEASPAALRVVVNGRSREIDNVQHPLTTGRSLADLLRLPGIYRVFLTVSPKLSVAAFVRVLDALHYARLDHVFLGTSFDRAKAAAAERAHHPPSQWKRPPSKRPFHREIDAIRDRIRACYDNSWAAEKRTRLTVSTSFFVTAKGTVIDVDRNSTDGEVRACISFLLSRLKFDTPPAKKVHVRYEFRFP